MPFQPVRETERYQFLDVLRGIALFGVLLINLLGMFRVSLFQHILEFHTHPGRLNHLVDLLAAAFVEFKALTLFSFLFGAGVAIQAERSAKRGAPVKGFLLRRFLILLAFGLCHMFLIWNGDILILYAVCGLLMALTLPPIAARPRPCSALPPSCCRISSRSGSALPATDVWRAQVAAATRVYGHGTYLEILAFRWRETLRLILPLLWGVLPRTAGLMWWGAAAWRSGLLRHPEQHRRLLWGILAVGLILGGGTSFLRASAASSGHRSSLPSELEDLVSTIPLAFAYAAAVLLWLRPGLATPAATPFAAARARMALTNYLTQSIVLGFVFYGYGLALFGELGPAAGLAIAVCPLLRQLAFSVAWLKRFRFGPCEWLWRSLTYRQRQPLRR